MALVLLCGCRAPADGAAPTPASPALAPGTQSFALTVKGVARTYLLHVPPAYDPARAWPVVVMFHGGGGNAREALRDTGWAEKADAEGFLAVFPEGTPPDPAKPARFRGNPQTWNDGSKRANLGAAQREVADVEFVAALLADVASRCRVDARRVYATGFSNGASMSFRVARELARQFAAVAPVAGGDWMTERAPERPVPLLYITGTADPLNPIDGGPIRIGLRELGSKPPARGMIAAWAKMAGCAADPRTIYDHDGAKGVAYAAPGDTNRVVFYTIEGHGHHWPGRKSSLPEFIAGKNTARLDATGVIWEFFEAHALPAP